MDELMEDTVKAVEKLRNYLDSRRGRFEASTHADTFVKLAAKWKAAAAAKTPPEKKAFFGRYLHSFYYIHSTLVGYYISDGHIEIIPLFRASHDKIFGSFDVKRPGAKFGNLPTKVFNEFVKGISYFASEPVTESPVYHRGSSCGTKELDINAKFKRRNGYSHDTGIANMEHVRQCYIERLIYDAIYAAILHRQDVSHKVEKERMARLYTDMYPESALRVYVSHYAGTPPIFPTRLTITDGPDVVHPTYEEQYFKEGGPSGVIRCSKVEKGHYFHKFQTFEKEMPWLEGPHPTRLFFYRAKPLQPTTI